jgi:hypothetical protein
MLANDASINRKNRKINQETAKAKMIATLYKIELNSVGITDTFSERVTGCGCFKIRTIITRVVTNQQNKNKVNMPLKKCKELLK